MAAATDVAGRLCGIACVLAACAAQEAGAPSAAGRVALRLEFEPPLLAPGELHYAHECGEVGRVATACTSVDLALPPGPVAVTLFADGRRHERALRVVAGMAAETWLLADR